VDLDCSASAFIAGLVDSFNEEERVLMKSLNVALQVLLGILGADDDLGHFDAKQSSVKQPLQQVEDESNDSEVNLFFLLLRLTLLLLSVQSLLLMFFGLLVGNEFCQALEDELLFLGGGPFPG
jgi:hypothetical protein